MTLTPGEIERLRAQLSQASEDTKAGKAARDERLERRRVLLARRKRVIERSKDPQLWRQRGQQWMGVEEAAMTIGRSRRTLSRWGKEGLVEVRRRGKSPVFNLLDLSIAKRVAELRYQGRRRVAGPGRGHKKAA